MNVGLLILLNLLTAPIFFEIEELGNQYKCFPRFLEILKFQKTRESRWIKLFIVLVFLLFIISIAPTASGDIFGERRRTTTEQHPLSHGGETCCLLHGE